MRRWLIYALVAVAGLTGGTVGAQQSNVTNAVVIASLQAMGLFGTGYANGNVPEWSTASRRYLPSSGAPISASQFIAAATPTDCSSVQFTFTGDTDTGYSYGGSYTS